jgi:hypothetical protein
VVSYRPLLVGCLLPSLTLLPGLTGSAHASTGTPTSGTVTTSAAPVLGPVVPKAYGPYVTGARLYTSKVTVTRKRALVRRLARPAAAPTAVPTAPAATASTAPAPTGTLPAGAVSAPSTPVVGASSAPVAPVAAPSGLSGATMPKGDLAGWRQVMAEDFTGSSLPSGWGAYTGQPGGNPGGWWDPSHVKVGDGRLTLAGYRDGAKWVTGGVMSWGPSTTTYGKYEVRFRMDKGHGVKYALLLWPQSERWPVDGEIDFAEDGGGNRSGTTATLHYGASNSTIQRHLSADFSTWQTIGVEWTPGKLVYTLNGKPWSTLTGSMVPSTPMRLALQSEAGTCGDQWTPCPDATTPARVDLEVDWAVAYQRV